jgi:uncharacterized protein
LGNSCPFCGASLGDGAVFCAHCGKPLGVAEAPKKGPRSSIIGVKHAGTSNWEELKHLIVFYTLLLGVSLFFGLTGGLFSDPMGQVAFACVWSGIVIGFLAVEWNKVSRVFRPRMPKPRALLQVFFACVAAVLFLKGYFALWGYFKWPLIHMSGPFLKAGWPIWSIFLLVSVEPGIMEEIAFRGIILTRLSRILSRKESLVIQAALFSVLHLHPMIFVSHFVMGLLLGWVRLRTGKIYYGMALHMAWNAMAIIQELGK